ncbi:hypothetical protein JKG47_23935, partial [Acidithiobacillus sp. MC6.1]|nr:hypothetical protein [Acidithiobacillus sp. MC6.1]
MPRKIIDNVRDFLLDEKPSFLRHELNGKTEEDVLLWDLQDAADEGPADVVSP